MVKKVSLEIILKGGTSISVTDVDNIDIEFLKKTIANSESNFITFKSADSGKQTMIRISEIIALSIE